MKSSQWAIMWLAFLFGSYFFGNYYAGLGGTSGQIYEALGGFSFLLSLICLVCGLMEFFNERQDKKDLNSRKR
jgi:hypothetical protein